LNPTAPPKKDFREILAVGDYPPPINGQSEAFRLLVDRLGLPYLNISELGHTKDGRSNLLRVFRVVGNWWKCFRMAKGKSVVYISGAQSSFGFLRDLGYMLAGWARGGKVAVHLHGAYFYLSLPKMMWPIKALVKATYSRLDRVILLSKIFDTMLPFVKPTRLAVVGNGVPIPPDPGAKELREPIRLLYLSNLVPSKGILALLEAMEHLDERFRLDVTGGPALGPADAFDNPDQFFQAFKAKIEPLEKTGRATYHAVVRGEKKARLLAECDVLVLPTLYEAEAQPICVIEAMMAGMPIVATRHRDIPNMVPGSCGVLVDQPEPEAIAKAVRDVTDSAESFRERSIAARNFSVENFSDEAHLAKMRELFAELLSDGKGAG
jgi:glycosyltransferase involved in cell wall biosynthesis